MNLFAKTHEQLLPLLKQDPEALMDDMVRDVIAAMQVRIMEAYCVNAFVAYERYLDILSVRSGSSALKDSFTLTEWDFFEREFRKDPSQPEIVIGLGLRRLRLGDIKQGRHLIRRVATSGYTERALASSLLSQLAL